jgi:hypothetical protein
MLGALHGLCRNPLLHFSEALANHILVEQGKAAVLILNKCDLVPEACISAWTHWFQSRYPGIRVVASSAAQGQQAAEAIMSAVLDCDISWAGDEVDAKTTKRKVSPWLHHNTPAGSVCFLHILLRTDFLPHVPSTLTLPCRWLSWCQVLWQTSCSKHASETQWPNVASLQPLQHPLLGHMQAPPSVSLGPLGQAVMAGAGAVLQGSACLTLPVWAPLMMVMRMMRSGM